MFNKKNSIKVQRSVDDIAVDDLVTVPDPYLSSPSHNSSLSAGYGIQHIQKYREFSPYANFISANFITAVFQNYY